jgi:hypothetical protein
LNADKRFAAVNPITVLEITEMIEKYTHLQFHAPTDTIQKNGNAKVVIKSVRGIKNKEKLLSIPHAKGKIDCAKYIQNNFVCAFCNISIIC